MERLAHLTRSHEAPGGDCEGVGAESSDFLYSHGARSLVSPRNGVPAHSWWGSFLHSFVVTNAGWIAILVALAELAIGAALDVGFLTPLACLGSLLLLFTYVMSSTASVCAFYALFTVIILTTWRTSGWIGVDALISGRRQRPRNAKRALALDRRDVAPSEAVDESDVVPD